MKKGAAVLAALVAAGALPATATAHKYTAYAGEPSAAPASAPKTATLNAFLPAKLKVRAGDKVQYLNNAFHTVSVLAKGTDRPALAVPDPGATYSGINDPQGNPFFFNGRPKFKYNPEVFAPAGSTTVGDGKAHNSGAFGGSDKGPGKYTLKFAKPGSYKVLCLLHPGMEQRVKVLKKKAKGADKDPKVRAAVLKQSAALWKAAGKAAKVTPAPNTVHVGEESKQATLLTYLPNTITVQKGTTVAFINSAPSEAHNVVFGPAEPGGYIEKFTNETDLLPLGPGAPNQVSPAYVFGSEPPASDGTWTYTGKNYGNGFFWSPLMDDQEGDPPAGLPGTENIKFDTPGTYKYFCAIHGPDMNGTVVVQ